MTGARGDGYTILELMVVIVVFSALAATLLDRLNHYQELAEKAAMEATLRLIKTGLQTRLAELIVTNRQAEAAALETENPIQWLERKPSNYAGLYREPPDRGVWYFDARKRQLVYVVNAGQRLEIDGAGQPKQLRFQARLLRDPVFTAAGSVLSVTGVTLAPVLPYRWSQTGGRAVGIKLA